MTRGIHSRPGNGATNDWLTPPALLAALGAFDLDPCAHPAQFYRTAATMLSLPTDGLRAPWRGRVWLNPPYGQALPAWMERMVEHGYGTALVPARTEVESWSWPYLWEQADSLLFLRGRLYFHRPDGTLAGNAGHGSVLAAYSSFDTAALVASGLRGKLVRLKTPEQPK